MNFFNGKNEKHNTSNYSLGEYSKIQISRAFWSLFLFISAVTKLMINLWMLSRYQIIRLLKSFPALYSPLSKTWYSKNSNRSFQLRADLFPLFLQETVRFFNLKEMILRERSLMPWETGAKEHVFPWIRTEFQKITTHPIPLLCPVYLEKSCPE